MIRAGLVFGAVVYLVEAAAGIDVSREALGVVVAILVLLSVANHPEDYT